jgi:hypothetical protein
VDFYRSLRRPGREVRLLTPTAVPVACSITEQLQQSVTPPVQQVPFVQQQQRWPEPPRCPEQWKSAAARELQVGGFRSLPEIEIPSSGVTAVPVPRALAARPPGSLRSAESGGDQCRSRRLWRPEWPCCRRTGCSTQAHVRHLGCSEAGGRLVSASTTVRLIGGLGDAGFGAYQQRAKISINVSRYRTSGNCFLPPRDLLANNLLSQLAHLQIRDSERPLAVGLATRTICL